MQADAAAAFRCRYCGSSRASREWQAREMYFGTREAFSYDECADCGSLNIRQIPPQLASHYAHAGYGGHDNSVHPQRAAGWRQTLRRWRAQSHCGRYGRAMQQLAQRIDRGAPPYPWRWLATAGARLNARILDVGCGGGDLLRSLWAQGFDDLHGIDKFIEQDTHWPGLTIRRGEVDEIDGRFDFIMLHHALEHMPEPAETLATLRARLAPGGCLLVRVPLSASDAWRRHGVDWYQLDAPRHLYVPSLAGVRALAASVGLQVVEVDFDSTASQYLVSDGYAMGLSMVEQRDAKFAHVAPAVAADYERMAVQANQAQTGDQAGFFMRVAPT